MTIRKVGIWCNRNKAQALAAAGRLVEALCRHQIAAGLDEELYQRLGDIRAHRGLQGSDLIITLGGDGTFLSGLEEAMRQDAAMLGVNFGHLGFLTEIEPDQIEEAAWSLARGEYRVEERMLLRAEGFDTYALNDAVVTRAPTSARILTMAVYVNGQLLQRFAGDGLIIATPTGSTGYSMSAGGPLVAPGVEMLLLTPVCAHTPHAKPTVVPSDARIEVELLEECEGVLAMDGRNLCRIEAGGRVCIRKGERSAHFIRLGEENFFARLKSKLTDWGR